jgi:hypothetical protein
MKSSGNAEPQEGEKVTAMLRLPSSLKKRWTAYARARGLTLNAAALVLLDQQLTKAGYPPD